MQDPTLSAEEVRLMDAYWRAANYLSVGQIYLLAKSSRVFSGTGEPHPASTSCTYT
jgi:phosphoketolase